MDIELMNVDNLLKIFGYYVEAGNIVIIRKGYRLKGVMFVCLFVF